ncbi:MAG: sulfur carrier protein ThiS adenylyltransferase ThiF [archaeon]|nr:sulfur carrier protein ThiS adenylyltransferase ThiF [archaeon]
MTRITLNGYPYDTEESTLYGLRTKTFPDTDVVLVDGVQATADLLVKDGMTVFFGKDPTGKGDMHSAMKARNSIAVKEGLKNACVGVAGLGGLGSNICEFLTRAGVGKLVICDFDRVDLSNMNRQNYLVRHLGMYKTDATEEMVHGMDPFVKVEKHTVMLDEGNIPGIFRDCDVVCEAFDRAENKAMILTTMATELPDIPLVCGNGMGGTDDPNRMVTKQFTDTITVCGDGTTGIETTDGVMAPRVNICAGHMANRVLQILQRKD